VVEYLLSRGANHNTPNCCWNHSPTQQAWINPENQSADKMEKIKVMLREAGAHPSPEGSPEGEGICTRMVYSNPGSGHAQPVVVKGAHPSLGEIKWRCRRPCGGKEAWIYLVVAPDEHAAMYTEDELFMCIDDYVASLPSDGEPLRIQVKSTTSGDTVPTNMWPSYDFLAIKWACAKCHGLDSIQNLQLNFGGHAINSQDTLIQLEMETDATIVLSALRLEDEKKS